jgi:hypothetical protein
VTAIDLDPERTIRGQRPPQAAVATGLVDKETSTPRTAPDTGLPEENRIRRFAPPWQQDIRRRHVPDYGDWRWWWRARHVRNSVERRMLAAHLGDG